MADKLFPTDYTEVTTTQTTDFTPVYREWEDLYKIKTESLKWLDGACVESVSFVWNDMVFVLDDASTVTLVWAKTALVGTDWVWISSIVKTWTVWLVDTYTITYTDSSTSTFSVTNWQNGTDGTNGTDGVDWEDGRWIVSILKTNTVWVTDTYTITYTDSTTSTFNVTNGTNWTNGTDWEDWISFTPKWAYSSGTAYVPNDVVSYLGSSWIALQNTTGNTPSEWAYWTLNAAKGTDGTGSWDISGSGTANELAYFTAEKTIDNLPVATYPSLAELAHVKWVTSAIQTQIWNQVPKSLYDANTIIKADSDNTPTALTVWEQTLVGRKTWWAITALTPTEVRTMINVEDWAIANPMTTAWDIIYWWTDWVATRLAKGTAWQVLKMNSWATAPEWWAASWTSIEPIRIRIPWEMTADANTHQWVFRRNTTWATITISNVKIKVATAAAWTWASAAFNIYKSSWTDSNGIDTSATALFSSAIDLTTNYSDDTNVPDTDTVENWRWISLRCTASAGATNKASDVEVIIYYS
jgi:hypothetical protein